VKPEWKKAIRTSIQVLVSLVLISPVLLPELGLSTTAGVGASIVALSGLLSRAMNIPQLVPLFEKLGLHVGSTE
jgi:hypothetical protein